MATWGAYFSSYVKKNPGVTTAEKEIEPTITPIVPLNTNTDVKTIEPLLGEEDGPAANPSEDVKKRFDEKLGSVGNLGMGTASITRMPTLKSNSRGARMAKMFGYGTPKEEKVEEIIVEDKGEMVSPVEEVKEIKIQVTPEMSKIEKLITERKAAAIESRSASPENTQPIESRSASLENTQPIESRSTSPENTQPIESRSTSPEDTQPVQSPQPEQPVKPRESSQPTNSLRSFQLKQQSVPILSLQTLQPTESVSSADSDSSRNSTTETINSISPNTPISTRSSFKGARSSTKRASTRGKTKASISALDDLMAGFGEEFMSNPSTPKPVDNEKGVEKPALGKPRNQRKPKASISALDNIMAGLNSMEPATETPTTRKSTEVRKSEIRISGISTTSKELEPIMEPIPEPIPIVLAPAPEASKAVSELPKTTSQPTGLAKRKSKAVTRFPVVVSEVSKPIPNIPAPIVTTRPISSLLKDQLSPIPPKPRQLPRFHAHP
ncbi:hypothetical protein H4I96_02063 [Botrytis cinerea]